MGSLVAVEKTPITSSIRAVHGGIIYSTFLSHFFNLDFRKHNTKRTFFIQLLSMIVKCKTWVICHVKRQPEATPVRITYPYAGFTLIITGPKSANEANVLYLLNYKKLNITSCGYI